MAPTVGGSTGGPAVASVTQHLHTTQEHADFVHEREYFGFHPMSFIDDAAGAASDYFTEGVDGLEVYLKEKYATNDAQADAITNGVDKVLQELKTVFDVNMDKYEVWALKNIFRVPHAITEGGAVGELSEQDQHTLGKCAEAERQVDAELEELRVKLAETHRANAQLRQQQSSLTHNSAAVYEFAKELAWVRSTLHQHGIDGPMNTVVGQVIAQAEILRQTAGAVKSAVADADMTLAASDKPLVGPATTEVEAIAETRNFVA